MVEASRRCHLANAIAPAARAPTSARILQDLHGEVSLTYTRGNVNGPAQPPYGPNPDGLPKMLKRSSLRCSSADEERSRGQCDP
jgi:hypothetical protein